MPDDHRPLPSPPPARRLRYLAAVAAEAVGSGLYIPVSLLYFHHVTSISMPRIGTAMTLAALLGLAVSPLAGTVIDRWGARGAVVGGFVIRGVGFLTYPLIHDFWQVLLCATLVAIGDRSFQASIQALVSELARGAERDRLLASQYSLRNAGMGAGGLLAGLVLGADADWAYQSVVIGSGVGLSVAAALIASLRMPARPTGPAPGARTHPDGGAAGYRAVLRDRPYLQLTAANIPLALCYSSLSVILPVYVTQSLKASPSAPGLLFTLNTVVVALAQVPVTKALVRTRRTRAAALGGVVFAASFACFGLLDPLGPSPWLYAGLALATLAYTCGELLHGTTSGALASDAAPEHMRGRYLSTYFLSWSIAKAAAPALFTALLAASTALTWTVLAAGVLIGSLALLRVEPRLPARAVHVTAPVPVPTETEGDLARTP
ncbi:MFS transporter [Streptomyces sp. NPDC049813]|uniref:MFS transporter n=1 Tax=Streptomyces sp. NPDC049813 TaxID=3365597 RepID=UPI00378F831B